MTEVMYYVMYKLITHDWSCSSHYKNSRPSIRYLAKPRPRDPNDSQLTGCEKDFETAAGINQTFKSGGLKIILRKHSSQLYTLGSEITPISLRCLHGITIQLIFSSHYSLVTKPLIKAHVNWDLPPICISLELPAFLSLHCSLTIRSN